MMIGSIEGTPASNTEKMIAAMHEAKASGIGKLTKDWAKEFRVSISTAHNAAIQNDMPEVLRPRSRSTKIPAGRHDKIRIGRRDFIAAGISGGDDAVIEYSPGAITIKRVKKPSEK